MKLDEMRLAVHPGQGLVARFERTVLMVLGNPPPGTAEKLVDACRTADSAADRLRELGQASGTPAAAFFALVEQESTWQLFMAGAMKVSVAMEKSRREFDSTDPQGWVEEALRGQPVAVSVGGEGAEGGQPAALRPHRRRRAGRGDRAARPFRRGGCPEGAGRGGDQAPADPQTGRGHRLHTQGRGQREDARPRACPGSTSRPPWLRSRCRGRSRSRPRSKAGPA